MSRFVVDSWAWMEYLDGTHTGLKVKKMLEKGDDEFFTSIISFAEIISRTKRKNMNVETAEDAVSSCSSIVDIDKEIAKEAALFHGEIRKKIDDFGLGDAFVVIAARRLGAKVLTGDPHFKGIKETVMI